MAALCTVKIQRQPVHIIITVKVKSLYDKASRKIRKLENTEVFYKIDKCVSVLKKMLEEAVAARNADIHIIKAQTALGKTEQYAEIVKTG